MFYDVKLSTERLPEGAVKPVAQSVVVTEAVVEPMPSSSPSSLLKDDLLSSSSAKEDLFSSPTTDFAYFPGYSNTSS